MLHEWGGSASTTVKALCGVGRFQVGKVVPCTIYLHMYLVVIEMHRGDFASLYCGRRRLVIGLDFFLHYGTASWLLISMDSPVEPKPDGIQYPIRNFK